MIKQPLACIKENLINAQWIKAQSKSILCDQVPARVKYKNNQYIVKLRKWLLWCPFLVIKGEIGALLVLLLWIMDLRMHLWFIKRTCLSCATLVEQKYYIIVFLVDTRKCPLGSRLCSEWRSLRGSLLMSIAGCVLQSAPPWFCFIWWALINIYFKISFYLIERY